MSLMTSPVLPPFPDKRREPLRPNAVSMFDATRAVGIWAIEAEQDKLARTGDFRSAGHFAYAVARAAIARKGAPANFQADPFYQLLAKHQEAYDVVSRAATGMNEASDPDGAAPIPTDYARDIWRRMQVYEHLLEALHSHPDQGQRIQTAFRCRDIAARRLPPRRD